MIAAAAAVALALAAPASASWQRRVYYTDNACKASFGYGVQVWVPNAACAAPGPVTVSCEVKSTDARALSSEGTACDNAAVSDAVWLPPADQAALVSGANYVTVNVYGNAATPCAFDSSVSLEQTTYAADGKCYAFESGYYFKASCSGTSGQVQFCDDAECKNCKTGGPSFTSNTCTTDGTAPTRMFCTGSNAAAGITPPNGSGTNATASSPAAGGATSSPAPSASPASSASPSATARSSNAAAGESSAFSLGIVAAAALIGNLLFAA